MLFVYRFGFFSIFMHLFAYGDCAPNALWAVNCGGQYHVDSTGVEFMADPLNDGIASDHGKKLLIRRVPEEDMILYQTERYGLEDFSYEIPRPADGNYVLNLKFSEVWFNNVGEKVFDVFINQNIKLLWNFDIFKIAGYCVAHDEFIPLSIKNNMLTVVDSTMDIAERKFLTVDFVKGLHDNPKVNAIVLFKGTLKDMVQMPPLDLVDSLEQENEEDDQIYLPQKEKSIPRKERERANAFGAPPAPDPYESVDTFYLLPLIITMCSLIPVILCLCKL